jgi:MoxR-like ATPase
MLNVNDLIPASLPTNFPREGTWPYKVLMALAERGSQGATDDELADILQAPGDLNNVRPRRGEMQSEGFVVGSGQKRPTRSGKPASVWLLSPGLREILWPLFTTDDCDHLATVGGTQWNQLTDAQQRDSEEAQLRLALLARQGVRAAADAGAILVPDVSPVQESGIAATTLTASLSVSDEWTKRAAVVMRLSPDGLELGLWLAPAEEQGLDDDEPAFRARVRSRILSAPEDALEALTAMAAADWTCSLVGPDETPEEFDDFEEWAVEVGRRRASEATFSQTWLAAGDELDDLGHDVGKVIQDLAASCGPALTFFAANLRDPITVLAETLYWPQERARKLVALAQRSRQLLFAGPPGTGKTFAARTLAAALTGETNVRLVQFHPSYAYEDFIEGIRPVLDDDGSGGLRYELRPGLFREVVAAATTSSDGQFLVIDEINRANLPRVLGELLFALEYRGEGNEVSLPYSGESLAVPENLWLIGTMNTADRSVALMDAALRRRFKEFRLDVDYDALRGWHAARTTAALGQEAAERLDRLNTVVIELLDDDRAIGHSFLMREDLAEIGFEVIWDEDLEPVLRDHLLGRTDELDDLRDTFLQ